ncbi:N-alpha-acetyltransferase 40 isoform X2 [Pangasianodon hypophthalmus]|uniref:N-alpha-acetyltransferase 40 isoform X2 n=1 Tax=Pangasianodon hypophthalmus TaxID=310915 RepID=UPI0023080CDF|nr:N-alpha-acetyltransferase 40 isoform X2 [Pangasianodon hypophthalmus]
MGRKSNRAKEKKQRRLEERAAMDAVCAKVVAANKLEDPLSAFPVFKKYDRNGLNLEIECKRVTALSPITVEWAYELTRANVQTLYEQSEWGWKEREKREEMKDERAWYLLARDAESAPVAFSHFRFDVECGDEVLYCYELQLESKVRRKGLGKFLVQILQLIANSQTTLEITWKGSATTFLRHSDWLFWSAPKCEWCVGKTHKVKLKMSPRHVNLE